MAQDDGERRLQLPKKEKKEFKKQPLRRPELIHTSHTRPQKHTKLKIQS